VRAAGGALGDGPLVASDGGPLPDKGDLRFANGPCCPRRLVMVGRRPQSYRAGRDRPLPGTDWCGAEGCDAGRTGVGCRIRLGPSLPRPSGAVAAASVWGRCCRIRLGPFSNGPCCARRQAFDGSEWWGRCPTRATYGSRTAPAALDDGRWWDGDHSLTGPVATGPYQGRILPADARDGCVSVHTSGGLVRDRTRTD